MVTDLRVLKKNHSIIMVHTCCATCLATSICDLLKNSRKTFFFFFNPNIHPAEEYQKRFEALNNFADAEGLKIIYSDYDPLLYFQSIHCYKNVNERCQLCYRLRLRQSAEKAIELGANYLTTTLLSSPYQNRDLIVEEGSKAANAYDLEFVYFDMRNTYSDGVKKIKKLGFYRQKYCGCIFSEADYFSKKNRQKNIKG